MKSVTNFKIRVCRWDSNQNSAENYKLKDRATSILQITVSLN